MTGTHKKDGVFVDDVLEIKQNQRGKFDVLLHNVEVQHPVLVGEVHLLATYVGRHPAMY